MAPRVSIEMARRVTAFDRHGLAIAATQAVWCDRDRSESTSPIHVFVSLGVWFTRARNLLRWQ